MSCLMVVVAGAVVKYVVFRLLLWDISNGISLNRFPEIS